MNNSPIVRVDKHPLNIRQDEIIAFSCVRNESLRLPFFLEYYRGLGVNRFFFVDNNSSDDTANYLLAQPDVHVFHTKNSYAASRCGVDWLNELLSIYGSGHWTLTLDADELLIYPDCEKVTLRELTQFLDSTGADALLTFLLDMYSNKAIKDTKYIAGSAFISHCGYFDSDSYHEIGRDGVPVRGGPRHRIFWQDRNRTKPSPVLKKTPLVKWRKELAFEASTHLINGLHPADITGVLQHFKFFSDFYDLAKQEVARKEHWDAAAQYESYWNVLENHPDLSALYPGSVLYKNTTQLLELGLLKSSDEYTSYFQGKR